MLALRAGDSRPDAPSVSALAAVVALAAMATLIQAYVLMKLVLLALFVGTAAAGAVAAGRLVTYPRLILFYAVLAMAGLAWGIVGLFHHANQETGVTDAIRLYVAWSAAFVVLYTLLRVDPTGGLRPLHRAMVAAGIAIASLNIFGLADQVLGWGLMPDHVRVALDQFIGIHEGYVQITSQNIAAMFLIVPYLAAVTMRADASWANTRWTRLSLALSLLLAALSGRRALWLATALLPYTVLGLALASRSLGRLRPWARRGLVSYCAIGVLGAGVVALAPEQMPSVPTVEHVKAAFSAQDERSIQKPWLIEGFAESPWIGAGFGSAVRYLRDYGRPWTGYELTYFQMLFNLGMLGTALLVGLVVAYAWRVIATMRRRPEGSAVPFALLVAFASLLLGAYSNRYFGSFDLLFFVGFLPFLATFEDGYATDREA